LATAGAKHTSFDSCPPVEPKTSKGTKDNQGEGTSRRQGGEKEDPRGLWKMVRQDLSEGRSKLTFSHPQP